MKRDRVESLKHNAKLDVRLPDQLKDEFLARCREEGVSSGAVTRSLILDYVTARPRLLSVMAARLKETIMKRAKWIAGGVGGSALAGLAAMSFVFAPAASASQIKISYFIEVDRTGDWHVASGVADIGMASYAITMSEGEQALDFTLRARDCGMEPIAHCSDGQVYIEIEYQTGDQAPEHHSQAVQLIVEYGAPAGLGLTMPDGRPLSAVFTPVEI